MGIMNDPFAAITNVLEESGIQYELLEHDPVHTSEQAAQVRGMSMETGAKSLLLKTQHGFVLAVIQGDKRLDMKKFMAHSAGSKKPRFATPEEVEEQMGCQVGACYPLGNLVNLRTILDEPFSRQESISFNPGVHDKTIKLQMNDYLDLAGAELAELTQE